MTNAASAGHELRTVYLLDAPRPTIWRCWTNPRLLEQWFHAEGWTTEVRALELRPGGPSHLVMHGPNGEVSDGVGVFLEVVPEQRLVFTNAYTPGWIPADQPSVGPFRTMIIEMFDDDPRTRYVVRALHWTEEARRQHEAMGFQQGWIETTRRLEAFARSLAPASRPTYRPS